MMRKQGSFTPLLKGNNYTIDFTPINKALSGNRGFTDMDAVSEINGSLLMIEWKNGNAPLPRGQEILFESFIGKNQDSTKFHLGLCVWGNHTKMSVHRVKMWFKKEGKLQVDERPATMESLQGIISRWETIVDKSL